ncbi:MAG TPA: hypothetical protein H9903_09420 [Candidatus Aquabacterium excrementipullorum]|nr:hypothetical protein [Candidatus Aquabacterium excrementipullorum]
MVRNALACALSLVVSLSQADVSRPPAGTNVDETRVVSARQKMPAPCVAVAFDSVTVVLSRTDLEAQALRNPAQLQRDEDRIARVQSLRAAALLSTVVAPKTADACAQVAWEALGTDGRSVVLDSLENGRALVRDETKGVVVPTVRIRYFGERCGPMCGRGDITVALPDGERPFLAVSWWVS